MFVVVGTAHNMYYIFLFRVVIVRILGVVSGILVIIEFQILYKQRRLFV